MDAANFEERKPQTPSRKFRGQTTFLATNTPRCSGGVHTEHTVVPEMRGRGCAKSRKRERELERSVNGRRRSRRKKGEGEEQQQEEDGLTAKVKKKKKCYHNIPPRDRANYPNNTSYSENTATLPVQDIA